MKNITKEFIKNFKNAKQQISHKDKGIAVVAKELKKIQSQLEKKVEELTSLVEDNKKSRKKKPVAFWLREYDQKYWKIKLTYIDHVLEDENEGKPITEECSFLGVKIGQVVMYENKPMVIVTTQGSNIEKPVVKQCAAFVEFFLKWSNGRLVQIPMLIDAKFPRLGEDKSFPLTTLNLGREEQINSPYQYLKLSPAWTMSEKEFEQFLGLEEIRKIRDAFFPAEKIVSKKAS